MAIFSQCRADLYNHAFDQPRETLADLSKTPQHIRTMLFKRLGGKRQITCGDVVDVFAPTREEARTLGILRAQALQLALDMFDEGHTLIYKRSLAPEVLDYMIDQLPQDQPMDYLNIWDVIEILRPSAEEARMAGQHVKTLKSDWQTFLNSLDPPVSKDGISWDDFDF